MSARKAGSGQRWAGTESALGCNEDIVTPRFERAAEQYLRFPTSIAICRVKEVDAYVKGATHQLIRQAGVHLVNAAEFFCPP